MALGIIGVSMTKGLESKLWRISKGSGDYRSEAELDKV